MVWCERTLLMINTIAASAINNMALVILSGMVIIRGFTKEMQDLAGKRTDMKKSKTMNDRI